MSIKSFCDHLVGEYCFHLKDGGLLVPLFPSDAGEHGESHVGVVLDGEDLVALVQDLHAGRRQSKKYLSEI